MPMRTRYGRARSSSLPPPVSPGMFDEVSTAVQPLESTEPWSTTPIPTTNADEPATGDADLGEADAPVEHDTLGRPRSSLDVELEDNKEESRSVDLGSNAIDASNGALLAEGAASRDGYVTPTRSARASSPTARRASPVSGSMIFPEWFGRSVPVDESVGTPNESVHAPLLSDVRDPDAPESIYPHVYGSQLSNNLLNQRMSKVAHVQPDHTSNESEPSIPNAKSQKHRSIYGNYKRPRRPSRSRSPVPVYGVRINEPGPSGQGGDGDTEDEWPSIPYLDKGKYKEMTDMDEPDSEAELKKAQVEADRLAALELQERLRKEDLRRRYDDKLNQLTDARRPKRRNVSARRSTSRTRSIRDRSGTPAGPMGMFKRASSRPYGPQAAVMHYPTIWL
ncbi:hypothetical protein HWV62_1074 [Athelia sp. TMB]|nr:hypothetical protein HWV62_1074 [Athelia sp. TMB]